MLARAAPDRADVDPGGTNKAPRRSIVRAAPAMTLCIVSPPSSIDRYGIPTLPARIAESGCLIQQYASACARGQVRGSKLTNGVDRSTVKGISEGDSLIGDLPVATKLSGRSAAAAWAMSI